MWFSIMLADYRQRTRSRSFWLTLMLTSAITFLLFPAYDAPYAVININGYRGIYNSAFIGDSLALLNSLVFPLFSFYLVKNSLYLDQHNKVDAILAASSMNRFSYLSGKIISNFFVLMTLCLTMSCTAIIVQYYRGESYGFNLFTLFKPQLILVVPIMLVIATLAVMFESIKALRGGVGNMLFLFLWMPLLVLQMESGLGANLVIEQLENAVSLLPTISNVVSIGGIPIDEPLLTFVWNGTSFDQKAMTSLFYILIFCFLTFTIAALFYQRYSPGQFELFARRANKKTESIETTLHQLERSNKATLSPLKTFATGFGLLRLLIGEFRLLARGKAWWWYGGVFVQIILAIVLPLETIRLILLPLFGIWSVLIFSPLGCRDYQSNTRVIIAYNIASEQQRLLCVWIVAIVLQLILASGLIIRLVLEEQNSAVLMLTIACFFVPALALTLGRITKTTRTFEMVYLLLWYMGPMERIQPLDFIGTSYGSGTLPIATFAVATVLMMCTLLVLSMESVSERFHLH